MVFINMYLTRIVKIIERIEAYNFKFSKILQVVETKNFVVSMSENFLTIQDPLTLLPLAHYQRKEDFSCLLYLGNNHCESCLLTGFSSVSNFLVWFLLGTPKMIHMMEKPKLFDVQFHFEDRVEELIENQVRKEPNISLDNKFDLKPIGNFNHWMLISVFILFLSIYFVLFK
jgi:hypothetical protein